MYINTLIKEVNINKTNEGLLKLNSVNQGDCLELMQNIADKSVDMILADLP